LQIVTQKKRLHDLFQLTDLFVSEVSVIVGVTKNIFSQLNRRSGFQVGEESKTAISQR
jgi:hypothetical protein